MNTGVYEIEKTEILKLDPFLKFGKPSKIAQLFGGKAGYLQAIKELEEELYINKIPIMLKRKATPMVQKSNFILILKAFTAALLIFKYIKYCF